MENESPDTNMTRVPDGWESTQEFLKVVGGKDETLAALLSKYEGSDEMRDVLCSVQGLTAALVTADIRIAELEKQLSEKGLFSKPGSKPDVGALISKFFSRKN